MTIATVNNYHNKVAQSRAIAEPTWFRWLLIGTALTFLGLFLFVPLFTVFHEALRKGLGLYIAAFNEPDAWSAIELTFIAAAIAVPLNLVFGVTAAWAIAKFDFKGNDTSCHKSIKTGYK